MNETQQTAAGFSVGLTGGIGSGKTFVARLFAERGVTVVDTDEIAHGLTAAGGKAIAAIRNQFGADYISEEGALDRARMRSLVFAEPDAKKKLEAILHPMIRAEAEHRAAVSSGHYVIFVVPLLIESAMWRQRVSRILVVDCAEHTQLIRVMKRSGLSEDQVRAIMATQVSRDKRLAAAQDVILNDGSLDDLLPQVERLHAMYLRLAQGGAAV